MPAANHDLLTVGLAQIAPVWLNRDATLVKIIDYIGRAAAQHCRLVTFGEALLPGYPTSLTATRADTSIGTIWSS